MPKHLEIFNFKPLLKHILKVFPSLEGKFNSVGLDHSGSQPFKYCSCFFSAGESHTSNHLSYLEGHIQRMEEQLEELCEELQRQKATSDHLRKFCESLQTQIRMMGAEQSALDTRPRAPLPCECELPM